MGVHMLSPFDPRFAVSGANLPTNSATAPPGEPDTPQLRAAEEVGLFPYPYAADGDSVKGHEA